MKLSSLYLIKIVHVTLQLTISLSYRVEDLGDRLNNCVDIYVVSPFLSIFITSKEKNAANA